MWMVRREGRREELKEARKERKKKGWKKGKKAVVWLQKYNCSSEQRELVVCYHFMYVPSTYIYLFYTYTHLYIK